MIETIEDHKCCLELVVRRGIALGTDVEAERWTSSLLAESLRGGHALASVLALDVGLELGEGRGHREERSRVGIALVRIEIEAHIRDVERGTVLIDDPLDTLGEISH